jgi:VWFA-related protein
MDMSESMDRTRAADRAIAIQYAQRVLRRQTDQAFVVNFDRRPTVSQGWTSDTFALIDGIRDRSAGTLSRDHSHGTAVFDTIYRACQDQFSHIEHATSGNFILLFSDGEDNASSVDLKTAVDMCQRSNTAIYAFRAEPEADLFSAGAKTLTQLTAQTGGRVFRDNDSEAGIDDDLRTIESEMRNQYRLVYKPAELRRDGAFHHIHLIAPERVETIIVRTGYYAPAP